MLFFYIEIYACLELKKGGIRTQSAMCLLKSLVYHQLTYLNLSGMCHGNEHVNVTTILTIL